jgi:hypothetical protein
MRRNGFLAGLVAIGSVLSWWLLSIDPSLDLPLWLTLTVLALYPILSTILSRERWWLFLVASALGTIAGMISGFMIWPPDPLFWEGGQIVLIAMAAAFIFLALIVGLALRRVTVSNEGLRLAVWIMLASCVAYGPILLALTPSLVAKRVVRNDRLAAERFEALRVAAERTNAEPGGVARICDGKTLKQHYSGPPFSDTDWKYIAGNFVTEDGYDFGVEIYCPEPGLYMIEAMPVREKGDGTRRFCADVSGGIGCGMGDHEKCLPCVK